MLELLRDLVAHKGHANAAMLSAVRESPSAASDAEVRELLHHILIANRFWLSVVLEAPFAFDKEAHVSESIDVLAQAYRDTHERESAWIGSATKADLERVLSNPRIPGGGCTVWQAVVQVCLHSQGHRAQCAKLIRRHGAIPPMTDFVLWLRDRPPIIWPLA